MNIEINYLAIFFASVASMGVGFLWYSPLLVGKQWMHERGMTEATLKKAQAEMGKLYALSFAVSLVTAYVLAHVLTLSQNTYESTNLLAGISSAFWMWLGFMMPVQVTQTIFSDAKNWKLFAIDCGYQFASVITMGMVLGLLG